MNERIGPGFVSLDHETLEKLQNNDPSVTKLYLFFDTDVEDDVAGNTDWEEEGYCTFGNNTHLKAVHILVDCYQWGPGSLQNFVALYEAIASCRSIQHLSLSGSLLNHNVYSSDCTGEARTFSLLKPLFKNNNLHSFDLWELASNLHGDALWLTTKKLVDVLTCCSDSSMRNLNIRAQKVDDDVLASGELWLTRHRNLKKLALKLGSSTFGRGICTALESLLTNSNPTLEYLVLDGSVIDDEGATILGNALGRSKSLKKFYLIESDGGFEMSQNGWSELSRGLMNSESSLNAVTLNSVLKSSRRKYENKEFIDVEVLRPEDTTLIGTALSSVSTLKSLDLRDNYSLSPNHWGVFLRGLLAGNSSLVKLMLGGNDLGDDGLVALGDMLLGNNSLKTLSLEGHRNKAKAASWAVFSKALAQSSIEVLNLNKSNIDNEALAQMGSNTKLKRLELEGMQNVDTTGWQKFFELLSNSGSKLEELSLSFNSVGNEGVPSMVDALSGISSLTKLKLANQYGKEDITNSSWSTFSSLLGKSSLVTLSIDVGVDEEVKACLASELANGSTLQTLILGGYSVSKGLGVLENVLCNKTSIDSLYTSNHTLQEVLEKSRYAASGTKKIKGLPGDINELMEMNKNANKADVARQKILRYHFFNGGDDINAQVLFDMDMDVMPQVVAWIGKDAVGFPLLHRLIRGMPSLCDYRGNAALVEAERKKRKL